MTDNDKVWRGQLTRRQIVRGGAAGAAGLLGASVLEACGGGGGTTTSGGNTTTPGGGKPRKGGTLTVGLMGLGAQETIIPAHAINYPDFARIAALFDNLYRQDANQKIVPWLAESATPNKDATRWTLKLRQGVTFHDGKTMDADDVVYTIKSWGAKDSYMAPLVDGLVDFSHIKKVDANTVEVGLVIGMAEFPSILTWPNACVIPKDFKDWKHPIGTGPFTFESFTPGSRSVFKANPNYWVTGKPYVDQLVINTTFTAESARANALLSGSVNYVASMDPTLAKANEKGGTIQVAVANGAGFFPFYIRTSSGVTADPRVRLALKLAADRNALVEGALLGYGKVQNDIVGFGLPEYYYSDMQQPHDPEQAKSLLKQAGVPDLNITLKTSTTSIGMTQAATLYAQQAKPAGIKVNLQQVPPANYLVPTAGYPFQFAQTGWAPIPSVPAFYKLAYYGKAAPFNETKWGYEDAKKLAPIKKALATVDKASANEQWRALQEQQFKEGGYLIWSTWPYIDGFAKNVKGLTPSPGGSALNYDWKEAWIEA